MINIGLHDVKDNEWKLQRKRKVTVFWKRNAVDLPIRRARRRYEYVVFYVDNDIEEEALKTYITTNESSVIELSRLSYRVLTYYSEKGKIMSGDFWPQDWG